MRALEILELKPALHISFEVDPDCVDIVAREWPSTHTLGDVADPDEEEIKGLLASKPLLKHGLIIGGAPCQPLSGLSTCRKGFDDPRSDGIDMFTTLVTTLRRIAPHITWHAMLEN
eukprot:9194841-Karenia_brevis.AAC.1